MGALMTPATPQSALEIFVRPGACEPGLDICRPIGYRNSTKTDDGIFHREIVTHGNKEKSPQ